MIAFILFALLQQAHAIGCLDFANAEYLAVLIGHRLTGEMIGVFFLIALVGHASSQSSCTAGSKYHRNNSRVFGSFV